MYIYHLLNKNDKSNFNLFLVLWYNVLNHWYDNNWKVLDMMSYEDYQLEHEYEEYMEKQYEEYMMYMEEQYYIQTEMPDDYVKQEIEDRELAEQNGVFDDDINLTVGQEMSLYQATSTLSELAKETNSTISDLLKMAGYAKEDWN